MTPPRPSQASPQPADPQAAAPTDPRDAKCSSPLCERPLAHFYTLPSECRAVKKVEEGLLKTLADLHYDEPSIFAVKLAVEEAVSNAIRHGNRMDPSRNVRIGWTADEREVVITVGDDGPGFDPVCVPDPTSPENLELPGGRGIMLMRAFMSEVAFNPQGSQIWLLKRNDACTCG